MAKYFFLWLASSLFFFPGRLLAQEVQVNATPAITEMVRAWTATNHKYANIDGWRVQILSTTDRQQADAAKVRFGNEFPALYADWVHEKPYYKVRVGACRTRMEALALITNIKDFYPGAYPAKDPKIHPRDFLNKQ